MVRQGHRWWFVSELSSPPCRHGVALRVRVLDRGPCDEGAASEPPERSHLTSTTPSTARTRRAATGVSEGSSDFPVSVTTPSLTCAPWGRHVRTRAGSRKGAGHETQMHGPSADDQLSQMCEPLVTGPDQGAYGGRRCPPGRAAAESPRATRSRSGVAPTHRTARSPSYPPWTTSPTGLADRAVQPHGRGPSASATMCPAPPEWLLSGTGPALSDS